MSEQVDREAVYRDMIAGLKLPLYNISDYVILDNGVKGHVCAVMAPWYYTTYIRPGADYRSWNVKDEHWADKNIYAILLETDERYVSLEEFKDFNPAIRDECIVEEYEKQIPKVRLIMIPEIMISGGA